jgi:release factor glutamine methyltransferase
MNELEYLKKYYKGNIEDAINLLNSGIPVQYIVGNVDFYGLNIEVNKNVLIPRFETEELIEKTIEYSKKYLIEPLDIVDLGTGSGCIAITLKKHLNALVDAVDISSSALDVAKKNAKNNNVDINFYNGDMLNPLAKKYDLIISNPPYISKEEEIMDIVKNNEPHIALYADNYGLYFYEEILKNAKKYLKNKAIIAFEIGEKQGIKIKEIALKYFNNSKISIEKDLTGVDRFFFLFYGID